LHRLLLSRLIFWGQFTNHLVTSTSFNDWQVSLKNCCSKMNRGISHRPLSNIGIKQYFQRMDRFTKKTFSLIASSENKLTLKGSLRHAVSTFCRMWFQFWIGKFLKKTQSIAVRFYLGWTKWTLDWLRLLVFRYLWSSKCMHKRDV
jgi:hypothetical protein